MKKILFLLTILLFSNSCTGQDKKEVKRSVHNTTKEIIQIDKIVLNKGIDTTLKDFNLTKNDNYSTTYNLNLDYEEFSFSPDNVFKYDNLSVGKINSLIIYYLKNDGNSFVYELELENNNNCESLIAEFNKKFGKQIYYKKLENTKKHPIFLDENGEQEARHITEELIQWNDEKNSSTYYIIYRKNLDSKENKLTAIIISNNSKKFVEWKDYRSLNMVFTE